MLLPLECFEFLTNLSCVGVSLRRFGRGGGRVHEEKSRDRANW